MPRWADDIRVFAAMQPVEQDERLVDVGPPNKTQADLRDVFGRLG
jgi:hypothetical protein